MEPRRDTFGESPKPIREQMNEYETPSVPAKANRWLIAFVVAALGIAGAAMGYGFREQASVQQLADKATEAKLALSQTQDEVSALTSKINDLTVAQQATLEAALKAQQPAKKSGSGKGSTAAETKRYKQLEASLADEQQKLKDTQDQVARNRQELELNLNATRDDLNGSIARTHEELVALAKRGERSYFEFDLNKAKDFQHIGPLSLSLRKADTKHKNYDLAMFVDDDRLEKKKVNLYEPIWIHTENESQPVQIVVNKIQKNHVHGYVSAPKYGPSRLAAGARVKAPATNPNASSEQQPPAEPAKQPEEPERRLPRP